MNAIIADKSIEQPLGAREGSIWVSEYINYYLLTVRYEGINTHYNAVNLATGVSWDGEHDNPQKAVCKLKFYGENLKIKLEK
jgi:hypothetical protein